MMNFSELTDEELKQAMNALHAEINKRKEEEKEKYRAELKKLLGRVNELQYKYDFEISCEDYSGDWISSASNFALR